MINLIMIMIIHIILRNHSNLLILSLFEEEHNSDGDDSSVDEMSLNGDACSKKGKIKEDASSKKSSALNFYFREELSASCE